MSSFFNSEPSSSSNSNYGASSPLSSVGSAIGSLGSSISSAIGSGTSSSAPSSSYFSSSNTASGNNLGSSAFSNFTPTNYLSGSSEFLDSNSLVAKMAFLLMVVLAFFVLLRLFIGLISYFTNKSNYSSVKLIDGMINASEYQEFKQEPSDPKSKTIYRSDNEKDGIEFTWSLYVFIRDIDPNAHASLYHVFHKGNFNILANGLNTPNNAPGLYINRDDNSFKILMNTYNSITEEINVPNIPRNKWLNVIIRCQNTKVDVYINGLIAQSYQLNAVPKQNYGSVHVAGNGGFPGFISNLTYYKYALSISEIQRLNNYGPNLKLIQGSGKYEVTTPDYLSLRWYFGGANDQYISPPTPPPPSTMSS